MERIIRVTGKGNLSVKPDMIRLMLTLEDMRKTYESYQDYNKTWKRKFIGYKFVHALKLEFDADNKRLGQVLYALAHAPVRPEFRIKYTIKDTEAAKNQLLGKAVADSREKALILTKAAGVTLGDIVTIDYSWGEITFVSEPMQKNMFVEESCTTPDGYQIDIEPDDIDVSDTVMVVWEII